MATTKKSSKFGLILMLLLFFLAGVIIAFTSGAAQKRQQTESRADVAPIALSFTRGNLQNGTVSVVMNANSGNVGIGFAELDFTFDRTKIVLTMLFISVLFH